LSKIKNDKYYTPPDLAEYIVNKTKEIIGEKNITEWLEPSAGAGVFLNYLPERTLAYDIDPEDDRIIKQDFLALELNYKKGRCIIGNPPFGSRNTLAIQFFKKSLKISDYIIFILPISQLNNNQQMYEFDLIYSENLGKRLYTDRVIYCCLNIYKKPFNNELNKKKNYKLKDVEIIEIRLNNKNINNYDIRIKAWGGNTGTKSQIGHEVDFPNQYPKEFCIKINNYKYKEKIIKLIKSVIWEDIYPMTATPNLLQWQIYKYLKEQIPELQ
jgi:predicted RNA methylase